MFASICLIYLCLLSLNLTNEPVGNVPLLITNFGFLVLMSREEHAGNLIRYKESFQIKVPLSIQGRLLMPKILVEKRKVEGK